MWLLATFQFHFIVVRVEIWEEPIFHSNKKEGREGVTVTSTGSLSSAPDLFSL
jgi:hypothetical protein